MIWQIGPYIVPLSGDRMILYEEVETIVFFSNKQKGGCSCPNMKSYKAAYAGHANIFAGIMLGCIGLLLCPQRWPLRLSGLKKRTSEQTCAHYAPRNRGLKREACARAAASGGRNGRCTYKKTPAQKAGVRPIKSETQAVIPRPPAWHRARPAGRAFFAFCGWPRAQPLR